MYRSELTRNPHRQLPAASELDRVLVRHSLAAGGCRLRDVREHRAYGGTLLWVAVKRSVDHAFQAYLNAARAVENLDEPLDRIIADNRLADIKRRLENEDN